MKKIIMALVACIIAVILVLVIHKFNINGIAQNEDVDELCKKVTSWMYSHPGERIRYERFKTR